MRPARFRCLRLRLLTRSLSCTSILPRLCAAPRRCPGATFHCPNKILDRIAVIVDKPDKGDIRRPLASKREVFNLLLGQHLKERPGREDNSNARGRHRQTIPNRLHVNGPILADCPVDNLPFDFRRINLVWGNFRKLRLLPHRDPWLFCVQDDPVHLLAKPGIRKARQRNRDGQLFTVRTTSDPLAETCEGVVHPRRNEFRVRCVLVVTVKPLSWFRPSTEENFHAHGANDTVNLVSESDSSVRREPSAQAMKPQTAANKLGLYLPATPEEFQASALTHDEFVALQTNPPEWLQTLRREGPHPRKVVAQKLGISNTALKNSEISAPLTTAQIKELLADQPEWLAKARKDMAQKRAEHSPKNEEEK